MTDRLALPDFAAIRAAHERIAPYVHVTPVITSHSLDDILGVHLLLKCENFQKVGAFKARGACNAVFSLPDDAARRGVVTHSSGNHGAALAYAAQRRGIPAHVVMPDNAPRIKIANVEGFGAQDPLLRAQRPRARGDVRCGGARDGRGPRPSVRRRERDCGAGDGGTRAPRGVPGPRRRGHARRAAAASCRGPRSRRTVSTRASPSTAPSPPARTMRRAGSRAAVSSR